MTSTTPTSASSEAAAEPSAELLAATELHPHARACLTSALAGDCASHAYLFHGPRGVGKADAALVFAAELLAAGSDDPGGARHRTVRRSHPDLTWVAPTGAHEMRIDDVAEPVLRGATRTPMEGGKRVFVLERAETMSPIVANRLLKTLEEPADFVHFILLTSALGRVLPTVVSRCQMVRFDPVPAARIAELLEADGITPDRAAACAALAGGDVVLARDLASDDGDAMRSDAGRIVACALRGVSGFERPWLVLAERAEAAGKEAEAAVMAASEPMLEALPKGRERTALARDTEQAAHRAARRARADSLDRALRVAALLLRDLVAAADGNTDLVLARDRLGAITKACQGRDTGSVLAAAAEIDATRTTLTRNVSEELTLQALSFRLDAILTPGR